MSSEISSRDREIGAVVRAAFADQLVVVDDAPFRVAGEAVIYKAAWKDDGSDIVGALRIPKAFLVDIMLQDNKIREQMRQEGEFQCALSRRNSQEDSVVPFVYDAGNVVNGMTVPYVLMEFIEGQTAGEYVAAHNVMQRLNVAILVAEAIQRFHEQGIVHRDLKPSNVMIARYGDLRAVKIIDFGFATKNGEEPLMTGFTPTNASPEQVLREGVGDPRTDSYLFGIFLRQMMVGKSPFFDYVTSVKSRGANVWAGDGKTGLLDLMKQEIQKQDSQYTLYENVNALLYAVESDCRKYDIEERVYLSGIIPQLKQAYKMLEEAVRSGEGLKARISELPVIAAQSAHIFGSAGEWSGDVRDYESNLAESGKLTDRQDVPSKSRHSHLRPHTLRPHTVSNSIIDATLYQPSGSFRKVL